MAFWIGVDWVREAEDREVRVGVAQGSGCYLRVQVPVATLPKWFSQGKYQVDARGEPGTMNTSGP